MTGAHAASAPAPAVASEWAHDTPGRDNSFHGSADVPHRARAS